MAHLGRGQRRPCNRPENGHSKSSVSPRQHRGPTCPNVGGCLTTSGPVYGSLLLRAHANCQNQERVQYRDYWALLNEAAPAVFLDTTFAHVHEAGRRGTQQPLHPLRVELTRKASHQEIYEAHYGCCVRFKARRNTIVFRTGDLELPFATYNGELLAILSPRYDREIARLKIQQTTSSRAKWMLKRLLGGQFPDIHEVAKELGMSSRTLQRRIAEEGSSFR
jgi:AraC-like DNA-binding protein